MMCGESRVQDQIGLAQGVLGGDRAMQACRERGQVPLVQAGRQTTCGTLRIQSAPQQDQMPHRARRTSKGGERGNNGYRGYSTCWHSTHLPTGVCQTGRTGNEQVSQDRYREWARAAASTAARPAASSASARASTSASCAACSVVDSDRHHAMD